MTYLVSNDLFPEIPTASIADVISYCKSKEELGLDIETSRKYDRGVYPEDVYQPGLDPYVSRVVMLQIGDRETRFVIDTRSVDITPLKEVIESKLIVGHNLKFEAKFLKHHFNIRLKRCWDTMLVDICLTNGFNLGYSLVDVAGRHLGIKEISSVDLFSLDSYNSDVKTIKKEGFSEEEFTAELAQRQWEKTYIDKSTRMGFLNIGDRPFTLDQINYGADDIVLPLLIKEQQQKGINGEDHYYPEKHINLENEFVLVLADIELAGMYFNPQIWLDIYEKESLPNMLEKQEWLDNWVVDNVKEFTGTLDLFSGKGACLVNWTSSKQVISLFKHLGFCPKEKSKQTGKVDWTVGDIALQKVLADSSWKQYHELIKNYLDYKEWEQACTTFGKDFLKYVHPITKRIHSSYRQILNTYRISSTRPNCQNIPGGKHREAFSAPNGWKIINADFSNQETVVLANLSDNKAMCDMLNSGADAHCFTATRVYQVKLNDKNLVVTIESSGKGPNGKKDPSFNPEHAVMRQNAKTIGFGIPYGKSAHSLKWDLNTDEDGAEDFIQLYYDTFPGLHDYFIQGHKTAFNKGYITIDPLTGSRYFFAEYKEMLKTRDEIYKLFPDNFRTLPKEQQDALKLKLKPKTAPLWKKFFTLKGKLERRSQNYPIQGTAGSITKTAAVLIRREIIEKNLEDSFFLTNLVHDETNSEARIEIAHLAAEIVQKNMIKAGAYWCKKAALKAEAKIVDHWTH